MKKLLLFCFVFLLSANLYAQNNDAIYRKYYSLIDELVDLRNDINQSYHLIRSWVFISKKNEAPDKYALKKFHDNYPSDIDDISKYKNILSHTERATLSSIFNKTKKLIGYHKYVMKQLNTFESYDNPLIIFDVAPMVGEDGKICTLTDTILSEFDILINQLEKDFFTIGFENSTANQKVESPKQKQIRIFLELHGGEELKKISTEDNDTTLYDYLYKKFDRYYSFKELIELNDFFRTKVGKKYLAVSKKIRLNR